MIVNLFVSVLVPDITPNLLGSQNQPCFLHEKMLSWTPLKGAVWGMPEGQLLSRAVFQQSSLYYHVWSSWSFMLQRVLTFTIVSCSALVCGSEWRIAMNSILFLQLYYSSVESFLILRSKTRLMPSGCQAKTRMPFSNLSIELQGCGGLQCCGQCLWASQLKQSNSETLFKCHW